MSIFAKSRDLSSGAWVALSNASLQQHSAINCGGSGNNNRISRSDSKFL